MHPWLWLAKMGAMMMSTEEERDLLTSIQRTSNEHHCVDKQLQITKHYVLNVFLFCYMIGIVAVSVYTLLLGSLTERTCNLTFYNKPFPTSWYDGISMVNWYISLIVGIRLNI